MDVTSVSKFVNYFRIQTTNKNAKRIKIKNIEPEEEGTSRREFGEFKEGMEKAAEFLTFLEEHPAVTKVLTADEIEELTSSVAELLKRIGEKKWKTFSAWKEICLLNSAIKKFRIEVERKTGSPAKPTTPGFREYALNRVHIAQTHPKFSKNVDATIPPQREPVGSLGANKGELELRTEFKFQNGSITDSELDRLQGVKKGSQKQFARKVREILKHAYRDDLFLHIAELNEIEDIEDIETVYELLLFKRYFALNGSRYAPSSGEGRQWSCCKRRWRPPRRFTSWMNRSEAWVTSISMM